MVLIQVLKWISCIYMNHIPTYYFLKSNVHNHVVTFHSRRRELFKFLDKLGGEMGLKAYHAYHHQVKAQINFCEAKYCDFCVKKGLRAVYNTVCQQVR